MAYQLLNAIDEFIMQSAIVLKKYILKAGVGEVIWAFLKGLCIILDIQVTVYACQPVDNYTPRNKEGKMFLNCLSVLFYLSAQLLWNH